MDVHSAADEGEKRVMLPPIVLRGEDVYPPELLAEARAKDVPGAYEEKRVMLPPVILCGDDADSAKMIAVALANDPGRAAHLPKVRTDALIYLVTEDRDRRSLSAREIEAIHDLALKRATEGDRRAPDLLRAAMQAALSRVA